MIREAIGAFNITQDLNYIAEILSKATTDDLIDVLAGMLASDDGQNFDDAAMFVRDLILIAPKHGLGLDFRERYRESSVVVELERLLTGRVWRLRGQSAYTLGKTGSRGSLPAMHQAFRTLLDTDPLTLPRLVGEIEWLELAGCEQVVLAMLSSPSFTTRWAGVDCLKRFFPGDSNIEGVTKRDCFERLVGDENSFVRAEADYRYREFVFEQSLGTLDKQEKRQGRKEVNRHKPVVDFWYVDHWFGWCLAIEKKTSYTIAELEAFIASDIPRLVDGSHEYRRREQTP